MSSDVYRTTQLVNEDLLSYLKVYDTYSVDFQVVVASMGEIFVVVDDILFPNFARDDEFMVTTEEVGIGGHAYLMVTITNITARDVRKQTTGYRTSFNLCCCPVELVSNKEQHGLLDVMMYEASLKGELQIMNKTGLSLMMEELSGKDVSRFAISEAMNGFVVCLRVKTDLNSFRDVHDIVTTGIDPVEIIHRLKIGKCCSRCQKYIRTSLMEVLRDIIANKENQDEASSSN